MENVVAKAGRAKRATEMSVVNIFFFALIYRFTEGEGEAESLKDVKATQKEDKER